MLIHLQTNFVQLTLSANSFFIDSSSKDFRSISCRKTSKSSAILFQGTSAQSPFHLELVWLPSIFCKISRHLKFTLTMFSRPEAKETESDLLRFQEQFLAGRLNPSAAVVRSNAREEPRASSPGDKRDSPCGSQVERDVVTFDGKICSLC